MHTLLPSRWRRAGRTGPGRALTSGVVLATAVAIVGGLVTAAPAAAEEPGDHPTNPYERTVRISLGAQARGDRCQVARAVHYGGPEMKTHARDTLAGPDSGLRQVVADWTLGTLGEAQDRDKAAGLAYGSAFTDRQARLDATNKPYAHVNSSGGRDYHAPEFGGDILAFTLRQQPELYYKTWDSPVPRAGKTAQDKAQQIFDGLSTPDDDWATAYKPFAGDELFDRLSGKKGAANDIATFLRFGGFPTKAPEPDSAEFRIEVENLKLAWAGCDSANPVDHYRALSGVVVQAHAEWEAEYAGQAAQRKEIVTAETAAAKELRTATDAMVEGMRQAWQADQILYWQKYWLGHKNDLNYPKPAEFTKATADLNAARNAAANQVAVANAAVGRAKTAADKAASEQAAAWSIADQAKLPRGRGLMYAQQSVQVTKASYAAAQAAAKTALTASNAAKATVADSGALYALSQTQAHALNTEFRKTAALEAAAQAKAAATAAEAQAKEAAANATKAKSAQATAESAEQTAKAGAAEAKRQRGIAETEKANAAREHALATSERQKAATAAERAQTERTAAGNARTTAETAGATAADRREAAEAAEARAALARSTAEAAERDKDAKASRAASLEAAAAAAEGTTSAGEARQAATEARSAANEATGAAGRARAAANDASDAAVNARAAATRASAAASRSRAAADSAWSAYLTTHAAAATAHAAAAEAIDAAAAARTNARNAEAEAKKAQAAAVKARQEATAAKNEAAQTAAWAAKTAGFALAAGQAAAGARDAANAVTVAADQAITVGGPYRETDTSAAFAVLVGQTSKTMAEQQAAAAKAKADEAAKAAAEAKALADKASDDAKIALQAAANAAADATKALQSAAAARASAAEADKAAEAAKKADANAQKYDAAAGADAVYASVAANDAESEAAAADREATDAERDAAGARASATAAEGDASSARATATQAETDATAAESAATHAVEDATAADKAADRAEAEERERERAAVKERVEANGGGTGEDLTADEEELLRRECGEECVADFRAAKALAGEGILDWLKANGGEILLEEIGYRDLERCFSEFDIESCLWTLVKIVPVSKAYSVGKAVVRVASGIGGFLEKSVKAKRTLDKFRKIVDDAKKGKGHACPVKPKSVALRTASAAPAATASSVALVGTAAVRAATASDFPGVGTIVNEGGVTIQIYSNDHAPPHAHVKGKGTEVRIGQNGRPLAGDGELSRLQKAVVDNNLRTIRENIRVAMERFKANGGC
ncbi:hypothetical protein ABT160_22895 [Streptomyces sp. NPDC001941]|uniref:hypothetical protein n=1 Tax=Streptomyces sp. NPDC001941 TaxID=3154659 RepID=UPI003322EACE